MMNMSDNQRLNRIVCLLLTFMSVRVNLYAQMTETDFVADSISQDESVRDNLKPELKSIYELPYSVKGCSPDWHRLWINTAILSGAFVGTLLVLECLPEDATAWNRAELQDVPLFKRWRDHVIKEGPEWDHDKFYFN